MTPWLLFSLALGAGEATLSLSLPEAIAIAQQGNLSVLAACDTLSGAEFLEASARGAFLPQVTPRYSRNENETTMTLDVSQRLPWTGATLQVGASQFGRHGDAERLADASSLTLSVTQPLLRGAGPTAARFDLDNARRAREARQRSLVLTRQAVAVEVVGAYYAVVKQRLTEEVAQQSLRRSQELARASAARMEVGLASRLDVLRAELQAAQAESALVAAEAAQAAALERFRMALGLDPGAQVEPAATALPEATAPPAEPLAELLSIARERRLDLREARDAVRDAERSLRVARLDLLPQLDLTVRASRLGAGEGFEASFRHLDSRAEILLAASYPLQRRAAQASASLAGLGVDGAERAVLEAERRVEAEVRERVRALETLARNIELQRRSVDVAQQQQRLASLRYERGLASNFDVVEAEASLVAARTALVSLRSDHQVALVLLRRATGELDPGEAP
jgi:outer membrane protein TolC